MSQVFVVPNRPGIVFSETASGTDLGATAIRAAERGLTHLVERVSGHTDANSIIQILDENDVVYEEFRVDPYLFNILCNVPIQVGLACKGRIVSSALDCQVNIEGRTITGI